MLLCSTFFLSFSFNVDYDMFKRSFQVKSVKLVFDPRPNGSSSPAAVVEFHTLESSSHVLSMAASGNGLRVGGRLVVPSFAKSTAPIIALAWAAQTEAAKMREMEHREEKGFNRPLDHHTRDRDDRADRDRGYYGDDGRSDGRGDRYGGGGGGGGRGREERAQAVKKVVIPEWPPSFEEDGAVWIFDPISGYFLHRATEMFYEPKSKWYIDVFKKTNCFM
jgi:hypothetical protein